MRHVLGTLLVVLRHPFALLALAPFALVACAEYQTFDSGAHLRERLALRLDAEEARAIQLPFVLDPELLTALGPRLDPRGSETRRAATITDFVFRSLDLRYQLYPTRDASGTFRARSGNCLSFTNLFVALARRSRLNAFYVEVHDAQRWSYEAGAVVSQGHIVAGAYLDGELSTFDFLPYQAKAYRAFAPIDDLTATAHYYNNLGAEALLAGDLERAAELVGRAARIDPQFTGALNNLGVVRARSGDVGGARKAYAAALAIEPDHVPVLTNLARLEQEAGDRARAAALMQRLARLRVDNPFFYIYQAQRALAEGDGRRALRHLADALRRAPELPEVHVALVEAFLAVGDLDRARHHLGRALRLDATHPEALRLARLLDPGARTESQDD